MGERVITSSTLRARFTSGSGARPNILFVDLSESADPLNDINALAEVCEPGTVVIAIGQVNDGADNDGDGSGLEPGHPNP